MYIACLMPCDVFSSTHVSDIIVLHVSVCCTVDLFPGTRTRFNAQGNMVVLMFSVI